jgi:hypothetical protein
MVRRECTWDFCVGISYTGDEGQLGRVVSCGTVEGVGVGRAGHLSKKLAVKW